MHTKAKIIADSVFGGVRITTFSVFYPWVVHAEVLRHKIFSHGVASSRAIPLKDQIKSCQEQPYIPYKWGAARKGMYATEEIPEEQRKEAVEIWLRARDAAIEAALDLEELGVHKENGAQLLKPFGYVQHLITSTDKNNFFNLRSPIQAREEMRVLSRLMKEELRASTPVQRNYHLPFVTESELRSWGGQTPHQRAEVIKAMRVSAQVPRLELLDPRLNEEPFLAACLVSAARCARISYGHADGKPSEYLADMDKGATHAIEGHVSTLEHQGFSDMFGYVTPPVSNFRLPWVQFRKVFANERVFGGGEP